MEGYPIGGVNVTIIRGSMSFATDEAYYRHVEKAHFISRLHAQKPFILVEKQKGAA